MKEDKDGFKSKASKWERISIISEEKSISS
jgi:hypothetical protein